MTEGLIPLHRGQVVGPQNGQQEVVGECPEARVVSPWHAAALISVGDFGSGFGDTHRSSCRPLPHLRAATPHCARCCHIAAHRHLDTVRITSESGPAQSTASLRQARPPAPGGTLSRRGLCCHIANHRSNSILASADCGAALAASPTPLRPAAGGAACFCEPVPSCALARPPWGHQPPC